MTTKTQEAKDKLVALAGEKLAAELNVAMEADIQAFNNDLVNLIYAHIDGSRSRLILQTEAGAPEGSKGELLVYLRNETMHLLVCALLEQAGNYGAAAGTPASEYAHHALTHYEVGVLKAFKIVKLNLTQTPEEDEPTAERVAPSGPAS